MDAPERPRGPFPTPAPPDPSPGWPPVTYERRPWRLLETDHISKNQRRKVMGPYEAAVVPAIAAIEHIPLTDGTRTLAEEATSEIARFDGRVGSLLAPFALPCVRIRRLVEDREPHRLARRSRWPRSRPAGAERDSDRREHRHGSVIDWPTAATAVDHRHARGAPRGVGTRTGLGVASRPGGTVAPLRAPPLLLRPPHPTWVRDGIATSWRSSDGTTSPPSPGRHRQRQSRRSTPSRRQRTDGTSLPRAPARPRCHTNVTLPVSSVCSPTPPPLRRPPRLPHGDPTLARSLAEASFAALHTRLLVETAIGSPNAAGQVEFTRDSRRGDRRHLISHPR